MPKKKTEDKEEKTAKKEKADKAKEKVVDVEKKFSEKDKKELIEKAKKLAEKIEIKDEKDIQEEVRAASKKKRAEDTLFPLDDYVKYSAHLGTKAVTPNMRPFVYRRRADGIAVLNTNDIDSKLKEAVEFLKDFEAKDIFIACKREAGWPAIKKFGEVTGIKVFTKKYPAGIITNIKLEDFFETELIIICDPWLDKNALNDAVKVRVPVIALCDTNNLTKGVTKIVPCNNKSSKSLGLILYLLAREYLKTKKDKMTKEINLEDFTGVIEEVSEKEVKERKDVSKIGKGAKEGV